MQINSIYEREYIVSADRITKDSHCPQTYSEKVSASSGRDRLEISKGEQENGFILYFPDSAIVNRVISRGYITVGGTTIRLSEEEKANLQVADREAEEKRGAAYAQYVLEHEMAVARQQSAALSAAYEDMSRAMEVAAKISAGKTPTQEEILLLMQTNPKLYAMALAARSTRNADQPDRACAAEKTDKGADDETAAQGVSWSDLEWTGYETQMGVSADGAGTSQRGGET